MTEPGNLQIPRRKVTGFPPVAALPTNSPPDCLVLASATPSRTNCYRNFLPTSNPTILINKKGTTARAVLFLLVRMTGFEPTRISSLEPETSASAVPPHLHFVFLRKWLVRHTCILFFEEMARPPHPHITSLSARLNIIPHIPMFVKSFFAFFGKKGASDKS